MGVSSQKGASRPIVVKAPPRCNAVPSGRIDVDAPVLHANKTWRRPAGTRAPPCLYTPRQSDNRRCQKPRLLRGLFREWSGLRLPARAPLSALAAEDIAHRAIFVPALLALPRHFDSPPFSSVRSHLQNLLESRSRVHIRGRLSKNLTHERRCHPIPMGACYGGTRPLRLCQVALKPAFLLE